MDFQFGSNREVKHIKTECIGLIPDRGRSARCGGTMVGCPAHVGGQVARSRACLGPTLVSTVLSPLLSEFRDFRNRIQSCCHDVFPPHLFFLYTIMHNMWRQTLIQKEIESK